MRCMIRIKMKTYQTPLALLLLISFCTTIALGNTQTARNILGGLPLESCSTYGTALTGYTRSGFCEQQTLDHGSHLICINLNSTTGGNFCSVTGQPNWCSSMMPCHGSTGLCPIENWCVCQWAFARYIQLSGGCNFIQDIKCDAIHQSVLSSYQNNREYQFALDCLVQRCNIQLYKSEM